tara:strand:+ start:438 stop:734 length:297 start_codon:yes stop_codon:yes gene_type:complete
MSKKNVIHLEVKDGKKTILDKEVELKDLTIDEICEYEDILIEHTHTLQTDQPLSNIYKRTLKVIRLATNLTDDEIKDLGREGRMQLFRIIVDQSEKKS